jgi:hypothetical protein
LFVSATIVVHLLGVVALGSTWTGLAAPDNNWTTAGNWDSGVPGSGVVATFDSAGNGNTTISLGGSTQPIGGLFFNSANAATYTVGQLPGDALSFDDGGAVLLDASVTNPQTINATVRTNGDGLLITNNVSNGGVAAGNGVVGLTLNNVNIGDGGTLFVTNNTLTTTTALNGNITETAGQPGILHLISPAGASASTNNNFIINGNNTYSGGTIIQVNTGNAATAGSVQIGSDTAFGTGKITTILQSNSVELKALGGTRTISNAIDLNGGINFAGTNSIVLAGPIAITSGTSRTLNNKMTSGGATLSLGASPGSSVIYLGDPVGAGSILVLQAQNGATTIVNALFQDVDASSRIRYGTATGGNIIINVPQTYTSETQLGAGSAFLQFKHDYNVGDPSGPFGLGTLVANDAANIQLAPIQGDRTIANPFRLDFGFTVDNIPNDNSSVTFTGPITFTSALNRLIQNKMHPTTGGKLILGSAASPNTITLSTTPNISLTFHTSGRTIVNDTIQDSPGVPNNIGLENGANVTFNGPQNTNGNFTMNNSNTFAIINGTRTGTGTVTVGATTGTASARLVVNGSKTGGGAVTINSTGVLGGTGSIDGNVTNNGTIAPGSETLIPGTLTLPGNVTNNAGSRWLIGLNGTTSGKLAIGGNLDLSATDTLNVAGIGSGTSWLIATYGGSLTGTFNSVTPGYQVNYSTIGQIILNFTGLAGDWNQDGKVDAADYVTWRKDPTGHGGNPDGYNIWRQNFGNPGSASGTANNIGAVPEPAALILLLWTIAGLAGFRVRRQATALVGAASRMDCNQDNFDYYNLRFRL